MTWPRTNFLPAAAGTALVAAAYLLSPSVQVGRPTPVSWGVWLTWGKGTSPTVAHVAGGGGTYSAGVMLKGWRRKACDFAVSTDGRSVWVQLPKGDDVTIKKLP